MFNHGFHPFHLVSFSPWPLLSSISLFCFVMCVYFYMSLKCSFVLAVFSMFTFILTISQWFRDIIRESTYLGCHGHNVCNGLYLGVSMFIVSEVMFFFSFFFGYFFISLSPDIELGMSWPPVGMVPLSFYQVPLINTMLLLSSGVTITWSHYSLLNSNFYECIISLVLTVMLGLLFTYFQFIEYYDCSFCMSDGIYGSLFFISTGFHGFHVIIGSCLIVVCSFRIFLNQMSSKHHLGFEVASWYWHFVDVVWLFLYVSIYWWGS